MRVRELQAVAAILASGKPWYCYRHSKPYDDPELGCEDCQAARVGDVPVEDVNEALRWRVDEGPR